MQHDVFVRVHSEMVTTVRLFHISMCSHSHLGGGVSGCEPGHWLGLGGGYISQKEAQAGPALGLALALTVCGKWASSQRLGRGCL